MTSLNERFLKAFVGSLIYTANQSSSKFRESYSNDQTSYPNKIKIQEISDFQTTQIAKPSIQETEAKERWNNLSSLMNDPSIDSIECSGPGKNISIIQRGQHKLTNISLGKEEIDAIISNIIKETGAKLEQGLLQAQTHEYSASAVSSEFVGTRFIIQKKHSA